MPTITVKDAFSANQVVNTLNPNGQAANAASAPVTLSTQQDAKLDVLVLEAQQTAEALNTRQATAFYPAFTPPPPAGTEVGTTFDEFGSLFVRGGVTTDEGSVRVNFSGVTLEHSIGVLTFTNGQTTVTGSGILSADPPPLVGDYLKLASDAESAYARIVSIDSDTDLTLDVPYTGTGGTGVSALASMRPTTTGTGATITVASGSATIACNTTAEQTISLLREMDYGPLVYQTRSSVSQRITNQTIYRGLLKPNGDLRYGAYFKLSGTTNTTVVCETAWASAAPASGADLETTTVTIPNGGTTAQALTARIEVRGEQVSFYISEVLVATHTVVVPRPYDILSMGTIILNGTTPASNTNVVIDYEVCNNLDSLRVSLANLTDALVATQPPMRLFSYNVAGVIAINTDLLVVDCLQLRHLYIHCTSMGTTGVVTAQWSGDSTFAGAQTATLFDMAAASTTTFNAAVMRQVPVIARYFRLRLTTATTAGTTTIFVAGSQSAQSMFVASQPVTATGVAGAAAHDAAVSGNPVRTAGRALTANYTAVATGDTADFVTTLVGAQITRPYAIPETEWIYSAAASGISNTTTAVTTKSAAAAGIRNYITSIQLSHNTLGGTTELAVRDGAAGPVLFRVLLGTAALPPTQYTFPIPLKGTAATLLEVVTLTAVTGNIYVNQQGYIAP